MQALTDLVRRRQIRRKLILALDWIDKHRSEFSLPESTDYDTTLQNSDLAWKIKPFSELVFLLSVLSKHRKCQREITVISDFTRNKILSFDMHRLAAFDPSAATVLALFGDFFGLDSYTAPFERDHFVLMERSGYFMGMERMPYRDMDLAYSLWRLGYVNAGDRMDEMFANTAFGRGQSLPKYSVDDIYSLTHAIFYLTDVGFKPLTDTLDDETVSRLRRDLIGLTAIMLRGDNCDILGELMLCWIFCGVVPKGYEQNLFRICMDRMIAAAVDDGCVPFSSRSRERYLAGEAPFKEVYHTTLVAAILFAIAGEHI